MLRKEFTKDEVDFIIKNYPDKGFEFCAKELGRNNSSVKHKAYRLGLIHRQIAKRINLDDFINIQSPHVVYVLGFLWADGHVGEKAVMALISLDDSLDIKKTFIKTGDWTLKTIKRSNKIRNEKPAGLFIKYDKRFAELLSNLGYRDKSNNFSKRLISSIPAKLRHYFWRGFLDGDGSIELNLNGGYGFSFAGSFDFDWSELTTLLDGMNIKFKIQQKSRINKENQKLHRSSSLEINNKENFLKFLSYIYKDREEDGVGLTRKYQKFLTGVARIHEYATLPNKTNQAIEVFNDTGISLGFFKTQREVIVAFGLSKYKIRNALNYNKGIHKELIFKTMSRAEYAKRIGFKIN